MPKGIFIGLGGTGIKTVARLKALLFQRAYNSDKEALDADCTFIFYDTDSGAKDNAMNDVELQRMMGQYPVIDQGIEYVDAGPTVPLNLYENAKNSDPSDEISQRVLEWAIEPNFANHFLMSTKPLSQSASAQRMTNRMGICQTYNEMESRILAGMQGMQQLANQGANMAMEHPAIWVFSSSNGGTSSSALLDVLYMADRLYKANVADTNPYLRLVLYMPKAFIDVNRENALTYGQNAYATMWELNEFRYDAFQRNDGNKFGSFAVRPDKTYWKGCTPWNVCSYVMAVDTESQAGCVSLEQMYANTAELCYFLHTSAAGQTMISNIDNDLSFCGPFAGNPKKVTDDPFQWTKFVVGSGYKAITKADDFLKDYIYRRLHYDLWGYGLIGLPMDKILPSVEERMKAAELFATEYIMKHLANVNRLDNSPKGSLYNRYKTEFDNIIIPSEIEVPSKEEWAGMGTTFINNCNETTRRLQTKFEDPTQTGSMAWTLDEIEKSVMEGIDKNIIDFGLSYTYTLLALVDDEYCEKIVLDKLRQRNYLSSIEAEINDIIANNKPKKGIADFVDKMKTYRDSCLKELAIEHIHTIITNITCDKTGLLEYLRKGDMSHKGIAGVMETIHYAFATYKKAYQELASTFKKTEQDICNDYIPKVHEFVENGDTWIPQNKFEVLYSSILPLDTEYKTEPLESIGYGCPPVRQTEGKGLAPMLKEIEIQRHNLLYADMVMSNPQTQFSSIYNGFLKCVDNYVKGLFIGNNYIKTWLELPLITVFDDYFSSNGIIDTNKLQQYCSCFNSSVPVFYPCSTGATPEVTERWIYVGASQDFAEKLGYRDGYTLKQYVPDNNIGNRFLVCKFEIGHNLYDYKYFKLIKQFYESNRETIENEGSGCHIHKYFAHRNIVAAFDKREIKKFTNFFNSLLVRCFF